MATHLLSPLTHLQTSMKMALHAPVLLPPNVSSTTLSSFSLSEVFSVMPELVDGIFRVRFLAFENIFVLFSIVDEVNW